jgi:hypothetical protein
LIVKFSTTLPPPLSTKRQNNKMIKKDNHDIGQFRVIQRIENDPIQPFEHEKQSFKRKGFKRWGILIRQGKRKK